MATQITQWRAADGQVFETEADAVAHEQSTTVITFLEGKAAIFQRADNQDLIIMALAYLKQPGSPVTVTYGGGA